MNKVLIAYDDNDAELGDYFKSSFDDISNEISQVQQRQIDVLNGLDSTEANVNGRIQGYNGRRFVFIGLSHGNEEQLLTSNAVYVSENNIASFNQSFFYTTACSVGKILAQKLLGAGCSVFVGFDDTTEVWEDYHDVFIECENFALKEFSRTTKNIQTVVEEMKGKFNEEIDGLIQGGFEDKIVASLLISNRDKIVLHGDGALTRTDFQ